MPYKPEIMPPFSGTAAEILGPIKDVADRATDFTTPITRAEILSPGGLILALAPDFIVGVREGNCLKNGYKSGVSQSVDLRHVGKLILESEASLLELDGFGAISLASVKQDLALCGLKLGMRFDPEVLPDLPMLLASREDEAFQAWSASGGSVAFSRLQPSSQSMASPVLAGFGSAAQELSKLSLVKDVLARIEDPDYRTKLANLNRRYLPAIGK